MATDWEQVARNLAQRYAELLEESGEAGMSGEDCSPEAILSDEVKEVNAGHDAYGRNF